MLDIKVLKEKAKDLNPIVRIGKGGLSETVITEVTQQLKKRKLIKVKFLRSALEEVDRKSMVASIVEKTPSILVQNVGFVVVLAYNKE
jgi:RNA-binding protein